MQVSEAMTRDVRIARPEQSIRDAAAIMAEIDAGAVPVGENDRLVGLITDRDIAIRAIARGKGPDAKIADVMTAEVKYCFEDEDVDDVLQNLADQQIRRLPVVNRDKRLVGILSLGDIAMTSGDGAAGSTLADISRPGGEHSETGGART
ncbi:MULTISPECIES: CBS domain-containing protein [unclassified Sinorhizobium]|uniref:CBS domain-containing protein n=1 Tax=unclassified Sinorhizobium TaxID=2613772 RepID=UPI003525A4C5